MKGMRKANNQNRFIRFITLPIRALTKARDFYVRSMIDCSTSATCGASAMVHASSLPKSFSVSSSRSTNNDYGGDDLSELIRAASTRSLGRTTSKSTGSVEMDLYLRQQIRRRSTAATATVVLPRSCSVGMGKIDEERPCEFGEEAELVYPRSRSYAVTKRSVVF